MPSVLDFPIRNGAQKNKPAELEEALRKSPPEQRRRSTGSNGGHFTGVGSRFKSLVLW